MTTSATEVERYLSTLQSGQFFADATTPESFEYMVAYYRKHAARKRTWFRAMSVGVIIIGGLLPLVAAFATDTTMFGVDVSKNFIVAGLSAIIAILTGLTTYFRWEVAWRSQTEALFALQGLRAEWEAAKARSLSTPSSAALGDLAAAFELFRSKTFEVVHGEMGDFFTVQQAPIAKPPLGA